MGAACSKQFQNVPHEFPSEYEKQRQRIETNSIRLHHKLFKPSSKQVSIGMIDTIIKSQYKQEKSNRLNNEQSKIGSPTKNKMASTLGIQKVQNTQWNARDLDLQQLHATKRPFQGQDKIAIGPSQKTIPGEYLKNRQFLDFTFYHSLGLPEYSYRDFPEEVKRDYQNLPVCQQQDRSGVKYIGQWNKQLQSAHGNGVMQSNTTKYIGQFKNGLKHYHGRQIEKNEVYEGEFQNGRRKGKGIRYVPGAQQEGQFNQILVKGKILYNDESTYQGQLKNNKYHGAGIYSHKPSGVVQEGQFANGKLHGKGKIYKNGILIYDGLFEEDLKHGKGKYIWDTNNYYEGCYSRDKKHDEQGILRKGDLEYHGCFKNGQMDGVIRIFQISNGFRKQKKPIKFQNGIRSYLDDTSPQISRGDLKQKKLSKPVAYLDDQPSIFSVDGMPTQWKDAVNRRQILDMES